MTDHGLRPWKITITGGRETHKIPGGGWSIPKRDIVFSAVSALERGELKIPKSLQFAKELEEELRNFEVSISQSGHDSYSHRDGHHDDLLLAVSQGLWYLKYRQGSKAKAVPRP